MEPTQDPAELIRRLLPGQFGNPTPPPPPVPPGPVDTEIYMGPPSGPGDPQGVKNYLARNAPPPPPDSAAGQENIRKLLPPGMTPLIYDTKLTGPTLGRENAIEGQAQQRELEAYSRPLPTPEQEAQQRMMNSPLFKTILDKLVPNATGPKFLSSRAGVFDELNRSIVPGTAPTPTSKLLTPEEEAQQIRLRRAASSAGLGSGVELKGATPQEQLASLPPNIKEKVDMLLGYKVDATPYMLTRNADWAAASEAASQIDPTWNANEYPSRLKLLNDFKSGKSAATVRSLNTTIAHLGTLDKAFQQLSNSSLRAYNAVGNVLLSQTGSGRTEPFNLAANAVANEAATVFKNTSGTDQEIKAWKESLSPNMGPKDWESAKKTLLQLLAGRIGYLDSQFQTGMGKPRDFKLLSPKSQQIVKEMGGGELDEPSPTGAGPQAAPAAAPGEGQTATGPGGHRIVVRGGRWVDAQTGAPLTQ